MHCHRRNSDRDRGQNYDGRMSEREKEADRIGRLTLLHELSNDIIDGRNVVGIEGMP